MIESEEDIGTSNRREINKLDKTIEDLIYRVEVCEMKFLKTAELLECYFKEKGK
jgi:hypothetical protein